MRCSSILVLPLPPLWAHSPCYGFVLPPSAISPCSSDPSAAPSPPAFLRLPIRSAPRLYPPPVTVPTVSVHPRNRHPPVTACHHRLANQATEHIRLNHHHSDEVVTALQQLTRTGTSKPEEAPSPLVHMHGTQTLELPSVA